MSRNYELMRETGKKQDRVSGVILEAAVPRPINSGNQEAPHYLASEQTLGLVQRVFLDPVERPCTVVFAAVDHGNGCSQIAASVAECLSLNHSGAVCLVEGNFRSPSLTRMLGTSDYHGLTNALTEQGSIRSFVNPVCNDNLWLLSSGPVEADSPNLLVSERLNARFAELRREFDFVIVDAPPVARYPDAIALGKLSDGLVLIVEAESTRREVARIAIENVRASRIQVLGAVLNKRTFPIPENLYRKL